MDRMSVLLRWGICPLGPSHIRICDDILFTFGIQPKWINEHITHNDISYHLFFEKEYYGITKFLI